MLGNSDYYMPMIFLAKIQAFHMDNIGHDGKKSISTHCSKYGIDDVIREQTTFEALENFDIAHDLLSREISNFPTHLKVNTTDWKHTQT